MTHRELELIRRKIVLITWMPRVKGRWNAADVAHAEGYMLAREHALQILTTEMEKLNESQQTNQS